jgi:thioredoxin-related protein
MFICSISSANDGFILNSLPEANKLSRLTNKPVLLIFGADHCRFCESLKKDILDLKLSPHIDKYIICYVDIAKNPEYKKEYSVGIIPDSRIMRNNKEISKNKGYLRDNYIIWINNVK